MNINDGDQAAKHNITSSASKAKSGRTKSHNSKVIDNIVSILQKLPRCDNSVNEAMNYAVSIVRFFNKVTQNFQPCTVHGQKF